MGDIDFEEQIELERLETEKKAKLAKEGKGERVDPDGTVYEWDEDKQAWFPKIDSDFIAQYQMNYGEAGAGGEEGTDKQQADYEKYMKYYQNYNQAQLQHEQLLQKKQKEEQGEETHEETLQKLEHLENKMQEGESGESSEQYGSDSKEEMEKYTEEQKKEYNDYWSYYYGTDYHDYYTDCMAQYAAAGEGGAPEGEGEKEKEEDEKDGKKKGKKRKGPPPRAEGWFNVDEQHNTNVYVSGLPLDITLEEFKELMHKYGLIEFDPRTKQPKLKLYMDENGQPKGDGRCCFIKKESVDLILNLLDGADYKGHTIHVERAQFNLKGEYDPSKKKKKLSNKEKRRLKERQAKLFDWRPDKMRGERAKHERVVILKNVFDPKAFEDDPAQITTLTNNIRTECINYGDVKKVVVYDRHQDGVVRVMFASAEEADMCIQYMNQRFFAQRRLLAATWDGHSKYEVNESEAEREARLKKWEDFLEEEEKSMDGPPKAGTSNGSSLPQTSKTSTLISMDTASSSSNVPEAATVTAEGTDSGTETNKDNCSSKDTTNTSTSAIDKDNSSNVAYEENENVDEKPMDTTADTSNMQEPCEKNDT